MTYVWTLLALSALVALHELGHLGVARLCGMRVDRFSLGFGPTVFVHKRGGTEWALSLLPFGGYVRIAGMVPGDGTAPDDPASFANRPTWQRIATIAAGPIANYLIAFALLAGLYGTGRPKVVDEPALGDITPSSPAAQGGLKPDDLILSIDGTPVAHFEDLVDRIVSSQGHTLAMQVRRGAETLALRITPRPEAGTFHIGASPKTELVTLPWGAAIATAARETVEANGLILHALYDKLRGRGHLQIGGTVEVVAQVSEAAKLGLATFLLELVQISIFLALFNLLPVPALDGGRLVFLGIEAITRRSVSSAIESTIHAVGFAVLLGLIVYLNVGDVRRRLSTPPAATPATLASDAGP